MTSFFTSLHLLNLKQADLQHTLEIDCVKLSSKYNCPHGKYSSAKRDYFESRCSKCELQWRVKRNIRNVDKLFKKYKCLFLSWDLNQPLVLFFSNGSIVHMEFNDKNNTLLKVDIDNKLCGKFLPCRIVDVIICENCMYVTYTEPKLTLICNQGSPSLFGKIFGQKKGNLLGFEPKIVNFDLCVHNTKSLERKLSLNIQRNLLLVWWRNGSDDVWPWTPVTYLNDRVNMLLYSIDGTYIELLHSINVQDGLLHATFSKEYSNQIFSLEETKKEAEIVVNVCIHEIIHGSYHLAYTEKLPVRGAIITFNWSSTEDKLLAADSDGQLLIYDVKKKSTIVTDLEFIPKHLSWHPQSCIALFVSKNNRVMCFDACLNKINFKLCYKTFLELEYLELNSYFYHEVSVQKVLWQESSFNDTCLFLLNSELSSLIFIKFSFGCITRHNITAFEIISQYLKSNSFDEAILVLKSLDWCHKSELKFQCLSKIVNCLLRKPLNLQTQAGIQLALGTFYNWIELMPERVVKMYEHAMHHLSRRFFHHLLRYSEFKTALSMAHHVDSPDLYLDISHAAKEKGKYAISLGALCKAKSYNISESCSESSSSDCHSESSCSNDSSHPNNLRDDVTWSHDKRTENFPTNEEKEYSSNSVGHNFYNKESIAKHFKYSNYSTINSETVFDQHASVFHNPLEISNENSHQNDALLTEQYPEEFDAYSRYMRKNSYILKEIEGMQVRSIRENSVIEEEIEDTQVKSIRENSIFDEGIKSAQIRSDRGNSSLEEEHEELEGTQIKLAHLGII